MSLVEVLPVEPVTAIDRRAPSSRRQARASAPSAASGSAARRAPSAALEAPRRAAACSGATSTPQAPAASACGGELAAVDVLARAGQRTGRPARARASRCSRERTRIGGLSAGPRHAAPLRRRERRAASHPLTRWSPRRSPAGAQRVARDLRRRRRGPCAAGELLPLLMPLAGDHDDVARRGAARSPGRSRRGDRRLASTALRLLRDRPRTRP